MHLFVNSEQSVVSAFEGILESIVRYLLGKTTCYVKRSFIIFKKNYIDYQTMRFVIFDLVMNLLKHHQKDIVIILFEDHSEKPYGS